MDATSSTDEWSINFLICSVSTRPHLYGTRCTVKGSAWVSHGSWRVVFMGKWVSWVRCHFFSLLALWDRTWGSLNVLTLLLSFHLRPFADEGFNRQWEFGSLAFNQHVCFLLLWQNSKGKIINLKEKKKYAALGSALQAYLWSRGSVISGFAGQNTVAEVGAREASHVR